MEERFTEEMTEAKKVEGETYQDVEVCGLDNKYDITHQDVRTKTMSGGTRGGETVGFKWEPPQARGQTP